jgi:hypothetical protein
MRIGFIAQPASVVGGRENEWHAVVDFSQDRLSLGANGVILPLIADGDPLARGWIPLPAVCVVSSGAAPAASNPKASATATAAAAPTGSAAATRAATASTAMSRATASRSHLRRRSRDLLQVSSLGEAGTRFLCRRRRRSPS